MFMKKVGPRELKPGYVLVEDLHDIRGRLIFKSGTCLAEKHIRIIKAWGITTATISDEKGPLVSNPLNQDNLKEIDHLCNLRFKHFDPTSPLHLKLIQGFKIRLENQILAHGPHGLEAFARSGPEESALSQVPTQPTVMDWNLQTIKLPSLPSIIVKLNNAVNNPNCTAMHISEIVSLDLSLTARLLRLVNSAMYGFPASIDSIPRAITIIGPRQLVSLAIGTSVISMFSGIEVDILEISEFWKHSIAVGIIARSMISFKDSFETESAFIAGLLHDVGRLIMLLEHPEISRFILVQAQLDQKKCDIYEHEMLGTAHGDIGAELVKQWGLPSYIESSCRYHHHPGRSGDHELPQVIKLADDMANALGYGRSGEPLIPLSSLDDWEKCGLSIHLIDSILHQVEICFENTVEGFLS